MANKRIKKTVNGEKLFKGLSDFTYETRNFRLADTVVHPHVQKRVADVDKTLGAVQKDVDRLLEMLTEGLITPLGLLARDPLIVCGVLDDSGTPVQYVRVDGHTRIPALVAHEGPDVTLPVEYFEATERELIFAAAQANAKHGNPLKPSDVRAMVMNFLEDSTFAQLSDKAIYDHILGVTEKRNIGNWRRDLVIKGVLELMRKMDDADFNVILRQQIEKYLPAQRVDIHGKAMATENIGGDAFKSLYQNAKFDKVRPIEIEIDTDTATDKPTATDQATATDKPAATPAAKDDKPKGENFVPAVGKLDEVSQPVEIDDTDTDTDDTETELSQDYDHDGEGDLSVFEDIEFQTSATYGTVEIRTANLMIVLPISALESFIDNYRQGMHSDSLFATDSE